MSADTTSKDIMVLNISVPADADDIIEKSIVLVLRPQWENMKVTSKVFSRSFLNRMWLCAVDSDTQLHDALVVRVFREGGCIGHLIDHDNEMAAMQLAEPLGLSAPVIAIFNNGLVYQYTRGETLQSHQLKEPTVARLVAQSLAKLHGTEVNKPTISRTGERRLSYDKRFIFYERYRQYLDAFSEDLINPSVLERVRKELPLVDEIKEELERMEIVTNEAQFMKADLCHGDFHGANIIYDNATGAVTFVDFELARCGLVAFEFVHLLHLGYNFRQVVDSGYPHIDEPLTDSVLEMWLVPYLEQRYELQGRRPQDVTRRDIDILKLEIKIMDIYSDLIQAVISYMFLTDNIQLPLIELNSFVWQQFHREKLRIPEMAQELKRLRTSD